MVYSGSMNIHSSNSICIVRPIWLRRRDNVDTNVWFAVCFERYVQIHQISVDVKNSFKLCLPIFFSLIQGETNANGNSKVRMNFWLEASPLLFGKEI